MLAQKIADDLAEDDFTTYAQVTPYGRDIDEYQALIATANGLTSTIAISQELSNPVVIKHLHGDPGNLPRFAALEAANTLFVESTEAPSMPTLQEVVAGITHADVTISNAGDRVMLEVMLEKISQLSPESRRELDEFIEELLDYEEDKRDSRAMRAWAARALTQEENDEADL
jgi:hypothetical protein